MSFVTYHLPYNGRSTYGVRCNACGYSNIHVVQRLQLMHGVQRSCSNCGTLYMLKQAPAAETATDPSLVERRAL